MTKLTPIGLVAKTLLLAALLLAAALPQAMAEETATGTTEQGEAASPALMDQDACTTSALPAAEEGLFNPAGTPVCTFCNLTGFVNCESTDGTACFAPGTSRRCYINPPCACEWGICRCGSNGIWNCFW